MLLALVLIFLFYLLRLLGIVQSDQKENKSEQALQIINHVVAEFYANLNACSMHGRRKCVASNSNL
jgi:hypothetical protein